jgi:CMP-N-acetylneuraminic acid synthetase
MTTIAIQIPVKARSSERCPGKNFRELGGEKLWTRALAKALRVADEVKGVATVDVYVDSEEPLLLDGPSAKQHLRHPAYAANWANGNHLLNQFIVHHPEYDWYGQLFVTAPFLRVQTIVDVIRCGLAGQHPSVFTAATRAEMLWAGDEPVTSDPYRMDGEMRTQSMQVFRQTHGFYLTRGDVARETGCRIGRGGRMRIVNEVEAFDIDTEEDFAQAERMLAAMQVKEPELPYER